MVRIGINIPNELMKRLEPLKPELNISQVCRDALQAKAESHERALAKLGTDSVGEAVSRVNEQELAYRSVIEVDWEALGLEDAAAWVALADWEDWRLHHRRSEFLRVSGRSPNGWAYASGEKLIDFGDRIKELYDRIDEQDETFSEWLYLENTGIDQNAAEQQYDAAWLSYTDAVWKKICQHRTEYDNQRRLERAAELRDRRQPEVPDHILADVSRGH